MLSSVRRSAFVVLVASLPLLVATVAFAQSTPEATAETPEEITEVDSLGREVYAETCASCHQANGEGLAGAFPPLVDNPHVEDAGYLADVIANGRDGEIIVNGETFNQVMPAFTTLTEEEVQAVIDYVQNDLGQSAAAPPAPSVGPVAGVELPTGAAAVWTAGIWIGVIAVILVTVANVMTRPEADYFSWGSAWMRAAVIVAYFAIATVWLPSAIIEFGPVSTAPRLVQDLLSSGVWFVALAAGVVGLRYAQKAKRI